MSEIIGVMFKLLRSIFNGSEEFTDFEIKTVKENLKPLFVLSKKHDIAHLVGYALFENNLIDKGKDAEVYARFNQEQITAIYRYEQINYALNKLCAALENAKIDFIPLKGSVIRKYYPEPWMRTSCDIDILVKKTDLDAAVNYLTINFGYKVVGKNSHDVSMFSPEGSHLELHYEMVEDAYANDASKVLSQVWENCETKENCEFHKILPDEFFYFYHVAHMAKHFLVGGCGARTFLDLWILEHNVEHDNNKRSQLIEKGRLLEFTNSAKKLSEVWFSNGEVDDLCLMMQDYVLTGGVYGNRSNSVAVWQNKRGGKFKYAMSRIFISYNSIKYLYPVLEKHKWLTPLFQVVRWFNILFTGRAKRSINELKTNKNLTEEQQDKIADMLKRLDI